MKIWRMLQFSTLLIGTALFFTGCGFLKNAYKPDTSDSHINELVPTRNKKRKRHGYVQLFKKLLRNLAELFNLDFSTMDKAQIDAYLIEMTDLITAVREARDALTFH